METPTQQQRKYGGTTRNFEHIYLTNYFSLLHDKLTCPYYQMLNLDKK
jgi:hypothetical protein